MTGKGKRRRQLRIISQIQLSPAEASALSDVFSDLSQNAIVTGILGGVLVEHQLDILLREKFKRRDDGTWEQLVSENGPLRSFHTKIVAGYAFGIYDDVFRDDLNIVRIIRNTFAHSRQILDFDNELIGDELAAATNVHKKIKKSFLVQRSKIASQSAYVSLCYNLTLKLLQKRNRAVSAATRRWRKKQLDTSPIVSALFGSISPQQARRAQQSLLSGSGQNEGPIPQSPIGLLGGLTRLVPKSDDSGDK